MNIFITGESGTIASSIIEYSKKYKINVVNDYNNDLFNINKLKTWKSFSYRNPELDFTNRELLFSLKDMWENVDCIVHCGAFVNTDLCGARSNDAINVNVQGTKNIVDIANAFNIKLIYFSTTAIYDPSDYSQYKLINYDTNKKPKTLYGITKYAGELVVERECKTDKIIIRPVFGFGSYPYDVNSVLNKTIYLLNNFSGKKFISQLDKNILKTYTRVENIAVQTLNILTRGFWNDEYNIGDNYQNSFNWFEYYNIICEEYYKRNIEITLNLDDVIEWYPSGDYLHYHQIETSKIERLGLWEKVININEGISDTIDSVIKNKDKQPAWFSN